MKLLKMGDTDNPSLTCHFDRKTLGKTPEIVSEMELPLYDRFKELSRVTIHAEPDMSCQSSMKDGQLSVAC